MIWILELKDVAFQAKVFNKYGIFDQIAKRAWEIQAIHICIVIVGQGSFNHSAFEGEIVSYKIDEKHLQKGMFVKVENFGIESKSKRSFEKGDMCMLSLNMYLINS